MAELDIVMVGERSGLSYAHIRPEWAAELAALEHASYPTTDPGDLYDEPSLLVLAREFPGGCFAAFDGDILAAMGLGIRTPFDLDNPQHTIGDIVPPDHSSSGVMSPTATGTTARASRRGPNTGAGASVRSCTSSASVCAVTLNLRGIVAGGVIPGYADHKAEMSADDYIAEVRAGRLYDATLSFQLRNGFEAPCAAGRLHGRSGGGQLRRADRLAQPRPPGRRSGEGRMIDQIDREIIKHLQTDGRMAYSTLGRLIGLSDAATRQRVNRLTTRGVIDIVAVTDPVKIGLGYQALLGISVTDDARKLAAEIGTMTDAVYIVMTAGRYDLIVELVCVDGETFIAHVNRIRTMDGIESVETLPYLGITKQTYDWGVG